MCGIVGAVARRDSAEILVDGLRRLEYRGYDSAGIALLGTDGVLHSRRVVGKVRELEVSLAKEPLSGPLGIAHTRWATHGRPTIGNAHPQICGDVALVHNGIIENHEQLRRAQAALGYEFDSETDTEVIVHQVHLHMQNGLDLLAAVRATVAELRGAYALCVISAREPGRLVAARSGSPLVLGIGEGEHFIASDVFALVPLTREFIVLEEGDVADVRLDRADIHARDGVRAERPVIRSRLSPESAGKGGYRHYMLKEIFEQPEAVAATLSGRIRDGRILDEAFGMGATPVLDRTRAVQIVACGTSYHAGLVGRHWLETIGRILCSVDVASEFRYREPVVAPGTLLVVISQSGETLDTLSALREASGRGYLETLAICNVPESSLTREAGLVMLTHAGPEIGVASTKAFTTQLSALLMLALVIGRRHGLAPQAEAQLTADLESVPRRINGALALSGALNVLAGHFAQKHHALYLGRGSMLPIAMEGALKLKEISYIHAEAYPAGELKHGPLALVDEDMPVVAVAPRNGLLEKLVSNLQEVRARGGELYVFADAGAELVPADGTHLVNIEPVEECIAPIVYSIPLQLLAYHVAVLKGADVDQPRNLAKSVTVE
jgi:glucosamine--fructose-6-phosphate aminotransferase (isomerizing)